MIQNVFVTPWTIFTPPVYRMMERRYVDDFFKTGKLLISSYDKFSKHSDEERKDLEGTNIQVGRGSNSTILAVTHHGNNAFVLCASAVAEKSLFDRFQSDAAIQINDTTSFATMISRHLPGVVAGVEGPCFYSNDGIECNTGDIKAEEITSGLCNNPPKAQQLLNSIASMTGLAVYFRKNRNFRHQFEYRMIWLTNHEVKDSQTICVPEARDFCTPLYLSDLNDSG